VNGIVRPNPAIFLLRRHRLDEDTTTTESRAKPQRGTKLAYLTLVAAVPEIEVAAIRDDATYVLTPTLVKGVSHLLSYWIQVQPLGQIMNSVIDGGDCLNKDFWHPLRPPMVHFPPAVSHLAESLNEAWAAMNNSASDQDDWLTSEVNRLLIVMHHAVDTGACIVTSLDFPADQERAQRVRIPWMPAAPEHGVPRRKWWKLWQILANESRGNR
jgi:hypothetical protein